jgi:hypothetical protein
MQKLNLIAESGALLTRTQSLPDPINKDVLITTSYPCDLSGSPLSLGIKPLPLFRDSFSGLTYVRVVEVIPSGTASADVASRVAIQRFHPVQYASADGQVKGWFVEAPDFNNRENETARNVDRESSAVVVDPVIQEPVFQPIATE